MYDAGAGGIVTVREISREVRQQWQQIDDVVADNTARVAEAFRTSGLTAVDLNGSTGYGYDDRGRDLLDKITAVIFGAPGALIRPQWVSGTHALATALGALSDPGQSIWIVTGEPYDSIRPTLAALGARGVSVQVQGDGELLPDLTQHAVASGDLVYVQRSRGYAGRRSWGPGDIRQVADDAHRQGGIVMVDNCYGEFTQSEEPGHWGADLVVGSLMKNPGGTIAPTGAYVAGREELVQRIAEALYAPGIGAEVGATAPYLRLMAQGLFLAPQMVGEALKGGVYISHAATAHGFSSNPGPDQVSRNDIVVAVELGDPDRVVQFCEAIQSWEPIDALARPEPWAMPGYAHPVIMAAGGFVAGGSLELSADAPMRPPYRVYVQGGVNRWHTKLAVDAAFEAVNRL